MLKENSKLSYFVEAAAGAAGMHPALKFWFSEVVAVGSSIRGSRREA